MEETALGAIIVFFSAFIFFFVILAIVMYVFTALSLYTMAKNKGCEHSWFAWIPFLNGYLEGELIGDTVPLFSSDVDIPYAKWILSIGSIIVAALVQIPYIGWVISVLFLIYGYLTMYRLYRLYNSERAVLFTVLSIIFSVCMPFFLFSMRNNDPVEYRDSLKGTEHDASNTTSDAYYSPQADSSASDVSDAQFTDVKDDVNAAPAAPASDVTPDSPADKPEDSDDSTPQA